MTRFILLRTGATDFDEEGRIKGTLNIPLNDAGNEQALKAANALRDENASVVYHSPSECDEQTAKVVAEALGLRAKAVNDLQNLDHGLWQGKLVEELREKQKKVYKQLQDQPETVCPPGGEMVVEAQIRVKNAIDKLIRRHRKQVVVIVTSEPLTSLLHSYLSQKELGDLWSSVCDCGSWLSIDVEPKQLASMVANQT